jgi:glutamine synthetase
MTDSDDLLEQKLAQYRDRGTTRVKLGLTDVDGVLRGKYVNLGKFESLMRKGGGFCDCVFGWDVDDQLYDGAADAEDGGYTGWHSGFPDARYRLLIDTERWLADEGCPFFLGEFLGTEDGAHVLCPRTRLKTILANLAERGLTMRSGFEYEFFVFRETPHAVREKGYRDLSPLTPGNFGYSVLRTSSEADRFNGLLDMCDALDCELEGLHCETGPGVWEAAMRASDGIDSADRANIFKTFAKVFFQRQDCMATFMAKWSMAYPGQSGHFHVSLLDEAGRNVFADDDDPDGMSSLQRQAVAGLQQFLPELLVLMAPTVNSYTRLVKGAWAPTASTWGVENRTAAVRVIPGGQAQRIECRVPGADANPYLVASAVAAAMLAGIEREYDPMDAVTGNAYDVEDDLPEGLRFPVGLRDATRRFHDSGLARQYLGEAFVDHFTMTRLWECSERDRTVDSWQLERYFEII